MAIFRGTCAKQDVWSTIINIMTNQSGWTQVSNNTAEDAKYFTTSGASDGYIFKSPVNIGTISPQPLYVRMKMISNILTNNYLCIALGTMKNYVAGSAGANGTITGMTPSDTYGYCNFIGLPTTGTANVDYILCVENHRIILAIGQTTNPSANVSVAYVGFPKQSTYIEVTGFIANIVNTTGCYSNATSTPNMNRPYIVQTPLLLGGYFSTSYVVSPNLSSITNPNYAGIYSIVPIQIITNATGANGGYLGDFDGLYSVPATNITNGDILTIGGVDHIVLRPYSSSGAFNSTYIAVRLS